MTQQEKRIKLAKAEGWKHNPLRNDIGELVGHGWEWEYNGDPILGEPSFPDYFNDLNAVHGLAGSLSRQPDALRGYSDYTRYCVQLERLCGELPYDATAEQRAEAIGITLGLWENGE